jgi:predicted aspartyl protease
VDSNGKNGESQQVASETILSPPHSHAILRGVKGYPEQIRRHSATVRIGVWLLSSLLLIWPLCASARSPNRRDARPQFEALPLIRSGQNQMLVHAMINGREAWLAVDSGSPMSSIALNRREHFRLTAIPTTSDLPPRVPVNGAVNNLAMVRHFRLGALDILDVPVLALDLGSTRQAARLLGDQEIDGVLGADVLLPTKAVLDCQRLLLILKIDPRRNEPTPGIDLRGLHAVPIQVTEGSNLYVNASINGMAAKLMVDTGAFATLLHRSFVTQMKIPMRQTHFISAGVNLRDRDVLMARIRKLSVGSTTITDREIGVVNLQDLFHERLLRGRRPVAGVLGPEILNENHGVIDFGTRTLYMRN